MAEWLNSLRLRVRAILRRHQLDRDFEDEVAFHVAMRESQLRQSGAATPGADARRRFGSASRIREEMRDMWTFPAIESVWTDVRFGVRRLASDRSFTLVAVMALALGIGANGTFLALVNALCLRGLPIDNPDRVMFIGSRDADDRPAGLSYAEFVDLRAASTSFEGLAAMTLAPMTIGDADRAPDRVLGAYVSAEAFGILRESPIAGRDFRAEDDRAGAPAVGIVGGGVWRARYDGDAGLIGRTVTVNRRPVTIVGVMPEGFRFPGTVDIWLPLAAMATLANQPREARSFSVFGRLKDGATRRLAEAELLTIRAGWTKDFPDAAQRVRTTVVPINEHYNSPLMQRQWFAFITVGMLVLIIACANVANLLLMRGIARAREMAVRVSIGGTRARIVRQLLIESVVLAAFATVVGLALAHGGLRVLSTMLPADALPYWMTFTLDYRIVGFLALVSLASVLVFGLAPAVNLSRTDPGRTLAGGRGSTRTGSARRWMAAFLAAECALTLVLLAEVVTTARQDVEETRNEFHVEGKDVLTSWVTLPPQAYGTADAREAFYTRFEERLAALTPGASAALASALPAGGGVVQDVVIRGRATAADEPTPTALSIAVSPRYFDVTRVPVRGTGFGAADGRMGSETAIVNERFVRLFLPDRDPIGEYVRVGSSPDAGWLRIVGVVPTIRQRSDLDPVIYLPVGAAAPTTMAVAARSTGDPSALARPLREALATVDPNLALYRVTTLERAIQDARWNPRVATVLLHSLTVIAALLALVGLYAVASHAVGQRRRELAVLAALGAGPRELRNVVLRPTMKQFAAGIVLGVACMYPFDRLFNVQPSGMMDAATLVPLIAAALIVAIVACLIPARHAARVDPIVALRYE